MSPKYRNGPATPTPQINPIHVSLPRIQRGFVRLGFCFSKRGGRRCRVGSGERNANLSVVRGARSTGGKRKAKTTGKEVEGGEPVQQENTLNNSRENRPGSRQQQKKSRKKQLGDGGGRWLPPLPPTQPRASPRCLRATAPAREGRPPPRPPPCLPPHRAPLQLHRSPEPRPSRAPLQLRRLPSPLPQPAALRTREAPPQLHRPGARPAPHAAAPALGVGGPGAEPGARTPPDPAAAAAPSPRRASRSCAAPRRPNSSNPTN